MLIDSLYLAISINQSSYCHDILQSLCIDVCNLAETILSDYLLLGKGHPSPNNFIFATRKNGKTVYVQQEKNTY